MNNEKVKTELRKVIIWTSFIMFTCLFIILTIIFIFNNDFLIALLSTGLAIIQLVLALDESNRLRLK